MFHVESVKVHVAVAGITLAKPNEVLEHVGMNTKTPSICQNPLEIF